MSDGSINPPADTIDTIILLSVDSLRRDRVHAERDGTPLTPNLDGFAEESLEFTEGISPGPGTADSVPAMLTGAYPSQFPGFALPSPKTEPLTLAEHLQKRGFTSAGFNQNNMIARRYNFDRGFDHYYDISPEVREENEGSSWRLIVRNLIEGTPLMNVAQWLQTRVMETFGRSLYELNERGDSLTDRAIEWLDVTEGKRFLWLHYMDTHHPYISSDEIQQEFEVDIPTQEILQLSRKARTDSDLLSSEDVEQLKLHYDCSIRFVDQQIGRVLDFLKVEDELEDALVVVTGDHGEEFLEHGEFGHRYALWDELIRVPLIVHHPELDSRDVEGQAPVQAMVDSLIDGEGWFDMREEGAEYIVSETRHGEERVRGCRGNGYKLMVEDGERTYTRYTDEEETVVDREAVPDEIASSLEDELAVVHERFTTQEVEEEELREDLAALGYLDE